jgi:hypothetical protein
MVAKCDLLSAIGFRRKFRVGARERQVLVEDKNDEGARSLKAAVAEEQACSVLIPAPRQ